MSPSSEDRRFEGKGNSFWGKKRRSGEVEKDCSSLCLKGVARGVAEAEKKREGRKRLGRDLGRAPRVVENKEGVSIA